MSASARSGRSLRRLWRAREGATALEFSLVVGPFIVALFGFFQYGWALHCASNVRWATEAAARSMALNRNTTEAQVRQAVMDRLNGGAPGDVTVTMITSVQNGVTIAQVTSTYVHHITMPMLPNVDLNFRNRATTPVSQT